MAIPSLKLGDGEWAVKETKLLATYPVLNRKIPVEIDAIRTTTATRVNDLGFIESVGTGIARIDYSSGEAALLVEPQRTNLSLYSNQFNNSYWTKRAGLTITDDFSISPDGTNNSSKCNLTSGDGYLFRTFNFNPSTTYTISVFAKIAGSFQFNIFSGSNSFVNTVNTSNEFQRFSFTFTTGATTSAGDFGIKVFNNLEIFGFQLEIGNSISSYIPTLASAITRNQDLISKTGISDLINSQEGVFFLEMAALSNNLTFREISVTNGTNATKIVLRYNNTSNRIEARYFVNNVLESAMTHDAATIINFNKIAFKYKLNDFSLFVNGAKVSTDSVGNVAAAGFLNTVNTNEFEGKVKQLQLYKTFLTDAECVSLTTL